MYGRQIIKGYENKITRAIGLLSVVTSQHNVNQ